MRAFSRTSTPLTKTLRRYFGLQTTWYLHEYTTLLFPFVLLPILRIGPVNCNSSLGCKKEGNSWFAITSCSTPLLLHDERNGLERVLLHFSHFEKETQKLDERLYRITLRYDQDDETELLIRVLSFGPVLEVVAPITFRQLMRNRIQKQTLYAARGFSQ